MSGGRYLGVFEEVDTAVKAIEELRDAGMKDLETYSPLPQHELEHALHRPQSPVRLFTLVGGLTGAATGFALAIWTSLDWPLIVGGKPIIALPPFVVIGFELTILFGALSTALGLFINARLGPSHRDHAYDPSFSMGNFGVLVDAPAGQGSEARQILEAAGAVEVQAWDEGGAV
jgi:molybdopterin-containing oxidoreductase family membrane subunit